MEYKVVLHWNLKLKARQILGRSHAAAAESTVETSEKKVSDCHINSFLISFGRDEVEKLLPQIFVPLSNFLYALRLSYAVVFHEFLLFSHKSRESRFSWLELSVFPHTQTFHFFDVTIV